MDPLNSMALHSKVTPTLCSLMLCGLSYAWGSVAAAAFNFQTFQNHASPDFIFLDSTRSDADVEVSPILYSTIYQYFNSPIDYTQGDDGHGALISHVQSLSFAVDYHRWKKVSIGIETSISQLSYYEQGMRFAFGDTRLFSKISLLGSASDKLWKLSLVPSFYLPTGNKDLLLSNSHGGAGGALVAEKKWNRLKGALNLGVDTFPSAEYSNIDYSFQAYVGMGLKYDLAAKWAIESEWLDRKIRKVNTGDFYVGGQYRLSQTQILSFGASVTNTRISGSNLDYRAMLGFRWTPLNDKVITRRETRQIETIQKSKTVFDCGPKNYVKNFTGRALSESEKKYFRDGRLPYVSTSDQQIATLRLGGRSGTTPQGTAYVQDAQVLFAVDLAGLPARNAIFSVKAIDLLLNVTKLSSPDETDTNMICLIGEKVCSGDFYNSKLRLANINQSFTTGKEPPNDFFIRQINETARKTSQQSFSSLRLNLPLSKLIENSVVTDTFDLLFEGLAPKTLYFVVAHDVYVKKDVRLKVELTVQSCSETDSDSAADTHESPPHIEESEARP